MKAKYDAIVNLWETYRTQIKCEFKNQELDKWDSFDKSKLNIKLGHFSGYDSPVNIYDFKSDFLKLYEKSVPFDVQADLLKNNYLEKEALTLVKNISDVKEIWNRLKEAYGDVKTLLSIKISELTSCEMIKSRDRTKIINSNSKISNLMRDLMQHQLIIILRTSCNYSDAFDQTCNLPGDERPISCDTPKEGKWKWRQLLEFLDKEIKTQQQRAIPSIKNQEIRSTSQSSNKTQIWSPHIIQSIYA